MNIKTLNEVAAADRVIGGSLKGYLVATRLEIEEVFGKPTWDTTSPDGKTTTEWVVELDGSTIATIYDYKEENGKPQPHETIVWHVGGQDTDVTRLMTLAMQKTVHGHYPN